MACSEADARTGFGSSRPFFLAVCYDPNFIEMGTGCYADRGFHLPLPFFCKIVTV